MRILMESHGYPPTLSGVTLVVQKLARALVRRGHAVTVITSSESGDGDYDEDEGVRLVRVRSVANPFWEEGPIPILGQKDLEEIAAGCQPELLHAHDPALLGFQMMRLARDTGLPVVATCYYVPHFVTRYLRWLGEQTGVVESIVWAYSIRLFNQSDHVVFATQAHRQLYVRQGLEVPTTSIISNGVDTTRYRPAPGPLEELEARYRLPPHPRILFVSRLAQDKEIDVLIRAMACGPEREGAHLLLVGRGDQRPHLEELTWELDLEHCVHFLGFVPEEDLPSLYRAADLFAIASKCEVQSLPLVAADALALPELVRQGVNGYLVPPDDAQALAGAVLRVLRHPDRAAQMGQASLRIAQAHGGACRASGVGWPWQGER